MSSAYGDAKKASRTSDYSALPVQLPYEAELPRSGMSVVVDRFRTDADVATGHKLLNDIIEEGRAWPFEEPLSLEGFKAYFLSDVAFVVRQGEDVVACFYIKPNFPGRCSHICNGGFITKPSHFRLGLGELMGTAFKRFAPALGYKGSMFNLVFVSNEPSVRLWQKLGFTQIGRIPRVGRLAGIKGLVDARIIYCDFQASARGVFIPALSCCTSASAHASFSRTRQKLAIFFAGAAVGALAMCIPQVRRYVGKAWAPLK